MSKFASKILQRVENQKIIKFTSLKHRNRKKMEDPKTDKDIEGCLHVPLQQKK